MNKKCDMLDTTRLTADEPIGNFQTMMNFAYDKDKRVVLRYGNGEQDIDLCEYISEVAAEHYCEHTPEEIMDGACMECDCPFAILFAVATQAAELRGRLKKYEDAEENGTLINTPCKVGDTVYDIADGTPYKTRVVQFTVFVDGISCKTVSSFPDVSEFGKRIFLTREAAERALEERK